MSSDDIFKYCYADQLSIAKRINIVEFLRQNRDICSDLISLTTRTYDLLKKHLNDDLELKELCRLMSFIMVNNPRNDLKHRFTKHVLRGASDIKISECLDALGPVLVGLMSSKDSFEQIC